MAAKKHARFALYVLVIGLLHAAWAAKKDDIVVDGCVTQFSCSDLTGPDISRTYIPDPVDCSVYYRCNGINLVRESCPSGEGFSTSSAACESLDDADCQSACLSGSGIRAIYEPDEPTMKPTPVSGWQVPDSTLNPCVTVVDCRVLPELTTVPDPLNCSLYYQCVGSMLQRGECPLGHRFDSFLGCVNSTRVRCLTCPNGGGILTLSTSTSPVTSSMTTEQATTSIYLTSTTVKTTKSTVPEGGNWQTPPTSFNPCLNVFDCSVLPDSTTVPDPTDCTNYYQCVNGQPVRRRCPDGGQFDFLIGCTPSSRVRCQTCPGGSGIITPTTPDSDSTAPVTTPARPSGTTVVTTPARPSSTTVVTTPARPSSTTVVTTPINLVRTVDPCQGEPVCNDSDIALYWPHKDDCILYFECTAGTIQPRQCPENYLFDTITNSCQNPLNATCQQPCSITYSTSESGSISGSTPKPTAHLSSYPVDVSSDVTTAGFSTVYLPCGVDPPCLNETVSLKWPFHHNICNRKYYECNFGVVSERQCEPSDRFSVDVSDCKRAPEATCIVICVELSTSDTGEGLSTQGLTSTITSTGNVNTHHTLGTESLTEPIITSTHTSQILTTAGPDIQSSAGPVIQSTTGPDIPSTAGPVIQSTAGLDIQSTAGPVIQSTAVTVIQSTAGPDIQSTAGPVIQSTAGPDIQSTAGPDIQPTAGPGIQSTAAPDIQSTARLDIQSTAGPYIQSTVGPNFQSTAGPDIQTTAGPDIKTTADTAFQTTTGPTIQSTAVPNIQSTVVPNFQSTAGPAIQSTAGTDIQSTAGPDIQTTAGPDIQTTAGPDIQTTDGPDIQSTAGPDILTTAGPDIQSTAGSDIQTTAGPDIHSTAGPGIQTTAGPDIQTTDRPDIQSTAGPDIQTTAGPDIQSTAGSVTTDGPDIQSTAGQDIQTTAGADIQTTAGPDIQSTVGQNIETTAGPDIQTTAGPDILTTAGPDIQSSAGPDILSTAGPDILSTAGPDIQSTAGPAIQSTAGSNIQSTAGLDIQTTAGPDIQITAGPDIQSTAGPDIQSTAGPDIPTTAGPAIQSTAGPPIQSTADPDIQTTAGPAIQSTAGPDIQTTAGPDIQSTAGPDIQTTAGPDIQSTVGPEIQTTAGPGIQTTDGPDIQSTVGPDIQFTADPDIQTTTGPDIPSTAGPDMHSTVGPDIQSTAGPDIQSTVGPDIQSTEGPDIQSTVGPDIQSTVGPDIQSTAGPDIQSTVGTDIQTTADTDIQTTAGPDFQTTSGPDIQTTTVSDKQTTLLTLISSTNGAPTVSSSGMLYTSSMLQTTTAVDKLKSTLTSDIDGVSLTSVVETTTSDLLSTDSFFSSTGSWTLQNPCDPWDVCSPGQMLPIPGQCKDYRHCVMGKWQTKQCNGSVKPFFDQETHECSAEPNCMPDCFEHDLSVDTDEILEGHRVQFTCSFKPTEQWGPQLVRYNWALDGIGIRGMPEGSRIQIQKKDPLDGVWESQLIFSPIHFDDRGSVRCEAVFNYTSGTEKTNTVEKWSNVIPLPTATITPLTVSKEQGQMVLIMCSGDAAAAKLTWYRDGTEISDDDDDVSLPGNGTVQTLIVKVKGNATYACQAQNSAGLSNMADCSITLILTVKHVCNATEARDVRWTDTVAGGINMQHCIPPSTGYATRRCSWDDDGDEAMWEEPNFNACVDEEFTILVNKVKRLEEGIGASNSSYIAEVSREIKDASAPVQDKTSPGNINLTTESLTLLATLRDSDDSAPIDDEEVENVVNTVSNLLSEDNFESWESLSRDDVSRPALLMKCMDIYGQKKAEQLPVNEQLNIMSPNTVLQADSLGKNTSRTMTYPRRTDAPDWITDSDDFIRIEQDTLLSLINDIHGDKFILSSSYYRTINSILPTVSENKSVASRIVALSIQGLTSDTLLSPPVEYSLLHDQSEENYTYACSFWNYSIDGGDWSVRGCRKVTMVDGRTTCQCDHLTNFAIIISPSPATDGIHYTILSVISLVGCVVSLVALVVTILIYVTMWKNLKSHQAVVLLNLCVALIIANVVFVAGIDKTEPEILCTIVAVLLHYFYLAAFFIMLVEGIELLLYIMYVFHVHRKRETAMLLITAWLLPLTIVGITMGVTKLDGYGNENFCWLTLDNGLLWAFVGPVLFIILVNFIIFVIVLRRITTAKIPTDVNNGKRRNRVKASLWNIVVITPILGLTWLFGVFAVSDDTVWFQYVFCIFNSLQGLLICIFHACCNKKQKNKSESSSRDKYKMKSSTQTKSSRLKSDSSGKNPKSLSVQSDNKGMLESLTPQERELYMRQLSESKEVPYGMDFISGNSDVSSGYSSQLQSDISDRTFNTFVSEENGTDENGTTWKAQPNETTQTNGLIQPDHVQYREQKANNDTDQDETDKRPVEKVLSTTSC